MADRNYKTTEAQRARSKRQHETSKEQCAAYAHEYNLSHREYLNAYMQRWVAANPENVQEYRRKSKERKELGLLGPKARLTPEESLERKRERTRKWRVANPDAASRNSKEWKKKNRAKILAEREMRAAQARAYRVAHLDKAMDSARQWKENNPDKIREYNRNRKARLSLVNGAHTASDIEELYRIQEGQCAGCNSLLQKSGPERFHVDHIVPLFPKDGGPAGSNHPENLQLLCPSCNLSKSNLTQEAWDHREGRIR